MKKRFMNKKVAAIAAAVGLTLGLGGVALAYFTSTGNGTGNADVGQPSNWSVRQLDPGTGTLYPCGATPLTVVCSGNQETLSFTVTNNSSGNQQLTFANLQTAIDASSGDITTGGSNSQPSSATPPNSGNTGASAVSGCLSTWFDSEIVSLNGGTSDVDVAGNGTATVVVRVGMEDANTTQNVCQMATPNVDLWVS